MNLKVKTYNLKLPNCRVRIKHTIFYVFICMYVIKFWNFELGTRIVCEYMYACFQVWNISFDGCLVKIHRRRSIFIRTDTIYSRNPKIDLVLILVNPCWFLCVQFNIFIRSGDYAREFWHVCVPIKLHRLAGLSCNPSSLFWRPCLMLYILQFPIF